MTKAEAIQFAVDLRDDDQLDPDDALAAYAALYGHEPDEDDVETRRWLWSHVHAHPDVSAAVEAAEAKAECEA